MKYTTIIIVLVLIGFSATAQKSSVEVRAGDNASGILMRFNLPFSQESKWGVMATINSNMPYDKSDIIYNYHIIQPAVYYKLGVKSKIKSAVFAGSFKNPKQYGPLLGVQAMLPFKNGIISLSNQHQITKDYTTNLVAVIEFKPRLSDKLHLYSRVQIMSETNFDIFTRSYQMLRLGLSRKNIQFGLSGTFDQFRNQTIRFDNYGVFIRTTL